jgi:type VI secretion system secreted protein Hcp
MPTMAYLTLKGAKQGDIRGSVTQKGREGTIALYSVSYGVETPIDSASGVATGKRQHQPIRIVKEVDQTTPQLFQALVTNETLTAKIEFWRPLADGSGTLANVFTITLTNALISSIKVASAEAPDSEEFEELEEVQLVYQKIEVTWVGGKTAADDWNAPA